MSQSSRLVRRLARIGLRILAGLGALFVVLIALAVVFRLALAEWALRHVLADAGATNVAVTVKALSPHRLELQPLSLAVRGQEFSVDRISVERPSLFSRSLGRLTVEGVVAALDLAQARPAAIPAQRSAEPPAKSGPSLAFPFEQVQVEGRITLAFQDGSRVLSIEVEAKPASRSQVDLKVHASAPGLTLDGRGTFDLAARAGEGSLEGFRLDLKPWQDLLASYLPPEAAGWTLDGTVTGDAHGKFEQGTVSGAAALHWRDGTIRNESKQISAAGMATDLSVVMGQSDGRSRFQVQATLAGPGLSANGHGDYDLALGSGDIAVGEIRFELKAWTDFLTALAPAAATGFKLDGVVTGDARGHLAKGEFTGAAALHLRDGSLRSPAMGASAEGIAADLVLPDLPKLVSAPNQLVRMAKAQIGAVGLTEGAVDLQLASPELVKINAASVGAFGGRVWADPFQVNPASPALKVVLQMADIAAQEILAIFPDAPQGEGILAGRIPLRYENGQVTFGEGRLALKPGTTGRIRFHNPGLLTQAWSWWMPRRKALKQIESGQEAFLVNEAMIELHPADAPAQAARVRLVGVPAEHPRDTTLTLDFNINMPLETIVNFGLNSNLHIETK
ncbi:MAG TPA: YdbH domain-containing protein [Opitutaceae bacterium]|nr:YdbH domain-containing protein [Opitutaceae bacterium]